MRIAVYTRKSKFTGKGESIENQKKECDRYIDIAIKPTLPEDEKISIDYYQDEGFSGKNLDRPQFQAMMNNERIKPYDYIVVYKLDRISRNVGDFATLVKELDTLGTSFVTTKENFDTSTPMGMAMLNVTAVFAQLERDTIAERIRDNMHHLAKKGRWTGGTTPLGYKSVKNEYFDEAGKVHNYYTLEIDENQFLVTRTIFEQYLKIQTLNGLETYLKDKGITTQTGKQWDKTNIRRVLTNPCYCAADEDGINYFKELGCQVVINDDEFSSERGIISFNRTNSVKRKANPPEQWIITVSTHKPYLSGKEWVHIQEIIQEHGRSSFTGKFNNQIPRNTNAILSGLLRCECGCAMRPFTYQSGRVVYICENKHRYGNKACTCPPVDRDFIEEYVLNTVLSYNDPQSPINLQISKLSQSADKIIEPYKEDIKELKKQKRENERQMGNCSKVLSSGLDLCDTLINEMNKKLNELSKANEEIDQKILSLSNYELIEQKAKQTLKTFEDAAKYLGDNFDNYDLNTKREIIRKFISKIIVKKDRNIDVFIRECI
jgi:site-specific DNA recombinase